VASRSTRSSLWNVCDSAGGPLLLISCAVIWRAAMTSLQICSKYFVMVRSPYLSIVLVLEFSDKGISQIGSRPDVLVRKLS